MIGGRLVVPKAESKPPFWRYNSAERQLYMSAFHISPSNAPYYVQALNHYQPDYLVGYACSHFFLARMIREQGLKVHQSKAVLTSSEKLTPEMRHSIEQAYRCPVFDAYTGVEVCGLASECERHQLHISPDVGILELLDEQGNPVRSGEPGEIIATGLLNSAQPLIRYRTGDWAVVSNKSCPCGRQMPVLQQLIGRLEDTVIGSDGREMVRFHGIFVGLPHVREGQVIQEALAQFRLRLVVDANFGDEDRKIIHRRFQERLGPVTLTFELGDRIERTARGKFRAVISKVQRNANQAGTSSW
jgi:phenylacetate-CoA ligase